MIDGLSGSQKWGLVGLAVVVALVAGYWLGRGSGGRAEMKRSPVAEAPAQVDRPVEKDLSGVVRVHVKGAVQKEGVFELQSGSRVEDALEMAGATAETDYGSINLAEVLKDGDEVDVGRLTPVGSAAFPIRINEASAAEIASLPGIGEGMAQEIVRWRSEQAPFSGPEDLERIPGIGPETVRRILPYVVFN